MPVDKILLGFLVFICDRFGILFVVLEGAIRWWILVFSVFVVVLSTLSNFGCL